MKAFITIDTIYLNVRYPYSDIFLKWFKYADGVDHRRLKEGIAVSDFVVRCGSAGYKISIWQHDARLFLTEDVDEKRGEGKGMGIWVQLGPKFIIQHINNLHAAVNELLKAAGIEGEYPIRITRLDVAVDLLGLAMSEQDLNLWFDGWVGRSKVSKIERNSRTGELETLYVGSRSSAVYLRVYDKVAQAAAEGDLMYWFDVWQESDQPVTRVEWEVKPSEGNFQEDLKDFCLFNGFSVRELLIYLLDWGRLCIPDMNDSNRRRWKDAQLWTDLRDVVAIWADGVDWPTSRYGKEFHGISEAYIKFVSGTIAGAMARCDSKAPSLHTLFAYLEDHGETWTVINKKALKKAEIIARL